MMNFQFRNAQVVDENGTIRLDVFEVDAAGNDVRSSIIVVDTETFTEQAFDAAKIWVSSEDAEVAPYVLPTLEDLRSSLLSLMQPKLRSLRWSEKSVYLLQNSLCASVVLIRSQTLFEPKSILSLMLQLIQRTLL